MSYQVLARKWRPRTFQEMVGQEHIVRMLTNALNNQRLHHAYLFTGTRGVGKTTISRIFAKSLNCEKGITSQPCDACDTCLAINSGKFLDLIEVDAASRTKVEDTRELLDNVQYTPTQGRFKIYLIDEVHMLSGHSFNALLKTLEEPPSYVKFLLATTDPKRLPVTILSRCLQFNLNHVAVEKIAEQLSHICTTENVPFEEPALQLLAKAADGSMRDALSLLDQAIAFCGEKITLNETHNMLGSVEQDALYRLLAALAKRDGKELLAEMTQLAEHGPDFFQLLGDLLSTLHQITVAQLVPNATNTSERIQYFAQQFSAEDIQLYYQIGLIGRRDLPIAPNPHLGFEMTLLRMLAFHPRATTERKPSPLQQQAQAKTISQPTTSTTSQTTLAPSITKATIPIEQPKPTSQKSQNLTPDNWAQTLNQLGLSGMALALASYCVISHVSDTKIELTLAPTHESLLNKKMIERIEQALVSYLNKPIKLEIKTAIVSLNTPASQQEQKQAERQADATTIIQNDAQVKKMIEIFDATLDLSSIKAIDPAAT